MTDEERKEQTKKVYTLKMWESTDVLYKAIDGDGNECDRIIEYLRVPGGWLVNGGESFIPMHKESEHVCTCNQSKNIKI